MGLTPSPARLIINADDFGISRGVNIGIMEAVEAGVVTSVSMVVNLPGFADAVARARSRHAPSLGLHLNLTAGRPLTAVPSLTRLSTGEFYPLPMLVARASLGLLDSSDIVNECQAQIDRMTEAGFRPTHLDSHRHVHTHPAISPAVFRAASTKGILQVRDPREPLRTNARDWRATLKKTGILVCARFSGRAADDDRIHFVGISLQGAHSFKARLFALIPNFPPGTTELMVHPGHPDSALAEIDSYTLERETELEVLCSREFRQLLDRYAVTLTSFGDRNSRRPREGKLAQHQ